MDPTHTDSPDPQQPPMVLPVRLPQRPTPRPESGGGFGKALLVLLLLASLGTNFLLCLGVYIFASAASGSSEESVALNEKHLSGVKSGRDRVAVIRIEGIIFDEAMTYTNRQIEKAAADPSVKAVVVRINSPGGTVTASDDLHRRLLELRDGNSPRLKTPPKPLVASFGAVAASGGYFIAMPAKHIVAERTTMTGSIGVYAAFPNVAKLADDHGVHMDIVKAGDVKAAGSMFREMKPQERQMWQDSVDNSYRQFLSVVEDGRPALKGLLTKDLKRVDADGKPLPDEVPARDKDGNIDPTGKVVPYKRKLADGGIFMAGEAKHHGLIDQIGTLDDAAKRAATMANLKENEYEVFVYERPISFLSLLSGGMKQSNPDFARLAAAAGPRMWYLSPHSEFAGVLAIMGKQ